MEVLIGAVLFLQGVLLGVLAKKAGQKKKKKTAIEEEECEESMRMQYLNFLNYCGSERGQNELE
ncbi:MAG: hypothetical protein RR058_07550 [Oscillospiraceae bacterium]